MGALFPDDETVRAVLAQALRAPSVHNTQPWQWRVESDSLHLYADYSMHLPHTDLDGRDLMLSCGASLHHCVVALAVRGWGSKVDRFPSKDADHLARVEVFRRTADPLDVTLAKAISRRRTDRRHYSSGPVPIAAIALMGARAARAGVMLHHIESLPKLQRVVAQAIAEHAADPEYLRELTTWSGQCGSAVGVPACNTPKSDPTAVIPGRIFAAPALAQPPAATSAADGAVALALGTVDDSPLARLRAGEATSLVLLSATALGLSGCPVTEPLELAETRYLVQSYIFADTGFPQMLLRVGWAPLDADPLRFTPRRRFDDVVDWSAANAHWSATMQPAKQPKTRFIPS